MSSARSKKRGGEAAAAAAARDAAPTPSPVKRKSSNFTFNKLEAGVKSPKAMGDNTLVLEKIAEFADKDVHSKGSGELLFEKGAKTAERVHISGGNSAVKGLYVAMQEKAGVGENDRPEFGGIM